MSTPILDESSNDHLRQIREVVASMRGGDFSSRLPQDNPIAADFNAVAEQLSVMSKEIGELSRSALEGKFGGQIEPPIDDDAWGRITRDINEMSADQVAQFRGTALAITSIANGELSRRAPMTAAGEVLELNKTVNVMGDQYTLLSTEVRRAAEGLRRGDGTGSAVAVRGATGTWADLLDSINFLISTANSSVHPR